MIIASRRPALALVAVPREFPDLVARAELIVVGTVTAIRNASNADGVPFTVVALGDLAVAKGSVDGPTYDLWMYGGTVGDVVVGVPDAPTFAVGERYVLFIHGNRREVFPLVGVGHGQIGRASCRERV